jgi:hypothetical protein
VISVDDILERSNIVNAILCVCDSEWTATKRSPQRLDHHCGATCASRVRQRQTLRANALPAANRLPAAIKSHALTGFPRIANCFEDGFSSLGQQASFALPDTGQRPNGE